MTTYIKGPGHRDLDGQVSQNLTANASASVNAKPLGLSGTTFGAPKGPTTSARKLAQSDGLSRLSHTEKNTSIGVGSGTFDTLTSPTVQGGKRGCNVVTNPFFRDDPCTGLSRSARKSWTINWSAVAGLLTLASPWIVAALTYLALRR